VRQPAEDADESLDESEPDDTSLEGSENEDQERMDGPSDLLQRRDQKKDMVLPRTVREKLAYDDAEIEQYEKKLGIKKGRNSLPQSFKDDGLDDLMGDLGGDSDEQSDDVGKRKRDYEDFLTSKRRKTELNSSTNKDKYDNNTDDDLLGDLAKDISETGDEVGSLEPDEEDFDDPFDEASNDDDGSHSFGGFDSDPEEQSVAAPRQRENPYVAPTTGNVVAKYIPPSLRKTSNKAGEDKERLRKQVQGLINRLTDANILSIVQSAEELYRNNPRGDVTEMLTDVTLAQMMKPESLPDQFFVLTGGFCAAMYKVLGPSFGSHLVRQVVKEFGQEYEKSRLHQAKEPTAAILKEASNLFTFLSQLYVFEVISCKIIFDYMERLLSELNELNAELLLRICRMAGRLLKKDDAQALKHVSVILSKAVAKVGSANLSARTKFMIETIDDLKRSKPKAKGLDSAVISEHVVRMKKHLGELKSRSRRLDGLSPMGIGLQDVEGADTQGKWWLVGASVPVKPDSGAGFSRNSSTLKEEAIDSDDEDMDIVLPDYHSKARAQDLRTPAQVAIFTALLSASDYEHGYRQFVDLGLKREDQLEIARVLVQCVGSESEYNEYYAMVGRQACASGRIRFALQNQLWQIFRGLGESMFGEVPDDEETAYGERMKEERRVRNVAKFYASLIADGSLTLAVLKPLDLPQLNARSSELVERLLICLLQQCRSKKMSSEDAKVEKVFGTAREIPGLAAGVRWYLRKRLRKTQLIGTKEAMKLGGVREKAQAAVEGALETD
jgi:nucleolar MIF4G domain-containing protein 1